MKITPPVVGPAPLALATDTLYTGAKSPGSLGEGGDLRPKSILNSPHHSAMRTTDQAAIAEREKEATIRIHDAAQRISRADQEADQALRRIEQQYDQQTESEAAKQEAQIQSIRSEGYARIRDLKRAQEAQIRKLQREEEKQIADLEHSYRQSKHNFTRNTTNEVRDLEHQHATLLDYHQRQTQNEINELQSSRDYQLAELRRSTEEQTEALVKDNRTRYSELKERYQTADQNTLEQFENQFKTTFNQQHEILQQINEQAQAELDRIRNDSTQRLATFASRQEDPFYQIVELGAQLTDEGDYYALSMAVPAHELRHLKASIQGDQQFVLSGHRSNQDELSVEPGHTLSTSSYQSFHETIPLEWPVDASRLSREEKDGTVTFRVPKKGPYAKRITPATPNSSPKRLVASRPNFPGNLPPPESSQRNSTGDLANDSGALRARPGSRTLT